MSRDAEHKVRGRLIECSCGEMVPIERYDRHLWDATKRAGRAAIRRVLRAGSDPVSDDTEGA
jgi:TolB-like protein